MWYPRITSIAVSFSFLFLSTLPNAAFGQRLGGGRPVPLTLTPSAPVSISSFDPFAPERVGLFRVPQHHRGLPGIERRRVRFVDHRPFPFGGFFGWIPYFDASTSLEYPSTSSYGTGDISPGQELELKAIAEGLADSLEVERVSTTDVVPRPVLRLTWRNSDLPAAQVALFLADSSQSVLSAQTLRSPPFTALFEPHPATVFVGMTVVWPDGTLSTRFVPY